MNQLYSCRQNCCAQCSATGLFFVANKVVIANKAIANKATLANEFIVNNDIANKVVASEIVASEIVANEIVSNNQDVANNQDIANKAIANKAIANSKDVAMSTVPPLPESIPVLKTEFDAGKFEALLSMMAEKLKPIGKI